MKTVELTDEQYEALLVFKNFVSMKINGITNPELLVKLGDRGRIRRGWDKKYDFEPGYTFGDCIIQTIGSVMNEQETGEVNYIT